MKKFFIKLIFSTIILFQISCAFSKAKNQNTPAVTQTASAQLTIKVGNQTRQFSRETLLQLPHLKNITVEKDPAYSGRKMIYTAVPLADLFDGVAVDSSGTLLFSCLDGFSAPISVTRVLNKDTKGSVAYIAIESPENSWPKLKTNGSPATAGPFYLIWDHPEKSKIVTEEWPFQLAGFEMKPSLEVLFPNTVLGIKLSEKNPVRRGYKLFIQNCFTCHTMNGDGNSALGPDLNIPYSPTEYLKTNYLEKLIRNPQNLRHWPQSKMAGFNQAALSNSDVQNIIRYLKYMSNKKAKQ